MPPLFSIPQTAVAVGLNERFRYWRGGSGRRYLFTSIAAGDAAQFEDAVILTAREGRIVFVGSSGEKASAFAAKSCGEVFVHLLARTQAERDSVVDDLSAPPGAARTVLHA